MTEQAKPYLSLIKDVYDWLLQEQLAVTEKEASKHAITIVVGLAQAGAIGPTSLECIVNETE